MDIITTIPMCSILETDQSFEYRKPWALKCAPLDKRRPDPVQQMPEPHHPEHKYRPVTRVHRLETPARDVLPLQPVLVRIQLADGLHLERRLGNLGSR